MQVYRGQLETNPTKFHGNVRLKRFHDLPGGDARVLALHFEPGSWTNWHVHAGRQVMYGIHGEGCVVQKGGEAVLLTPGDAVYLEPGVTHWHGGAPQGNDFVHAVIAFDQKTFWEFRGEDGQMGPAPVTVDEYEKVWRYLRRSADRQ